MWKCTKCGQYKFTSPEICHCKEFKIIDEDGEDHTVWALDEQGAALKYAEESNTSGDYYLMNEEVEITVNGKRFAISAEQDISYSASEIKEKSTTPPIVP